MDTTLYQKYAQTLLKVGVNLQKGQILYLQAATENRDIALVVVEEAFKMGAKDVVVEWNDPKLNYLRAKYCDEATLREVPEWKKEAVDYYLRQGACQMGLGTTYPDLMKDIRPENAKALFLASNDLRNVIRGYIHRGHLQWTGTALPNKEWAQKVYPELSAEKAYQKLSENILSMVRVNHESDPLANWQAHLDKLASRSRWLNEKQFDSLHITTKLGTDIEIGLVKNHIWTSAADMGDASIPVYVANMPTEEIFTDPDKYRVNGKVVASRPLNLSGQLVEGFTLTFKDGQCIEATATSHLANLEDVLNQSEASRYLGEVALVSKQSPITQMERVFFNGLIDENAASHLALGSSFPTNVQGGTTMTDEELEAIGVNLAVNHNDFMIGTEDMKVVGRYEDGREEIIMEHGDFII